MLKLSIKHRLQIIILFVFIIFVLLGVFVRLGLTDLADRSQQIVDDQLTPLSLINEVVVGYQSLTDLAHKTRAQMLFWNEAQPLFAQQFAQTATAWQSLEKHPNFIAAQQRDAIYIAKQNMDEAMEQLLQISNKKSNYELGKYLDLTHYAKLDPFLHELANMRQIWQHDAINAVQSANQSAATTSTTLMTVLAILALALTSVLVWVIVSVTRPMKRLVQSIHHVANTNDLSQHVHVTGNDELSSIARGFNQLMDNLNQLICELQNESQSLAGISNHFSGLRNKVAEQITIQYHEVEQVYDKLSSFNATVDAISNACQVSSASNN